MATESDSFSPYRPDGKLYGFVCVVTGADRPLGKAVVLELASHGAACVYACSSGPQGSIQPGAFDALNPATKVVEYALHEASEEDTLGLIDEVLNAWGRLDVYACAGGLLGPSTLAATGPNELAKCFNANAVGPFYALKYAPAAMAKRSPKAAYPNSTPKDCAYGSIIIISSVAGEQGGCWGPALTMTAHAALGVVKSGVAVLKGTGIRINAILAGQIDVGVSLQDFDMQGMNDALPPASIQSKQSQEATIGLERAGTPTEVARVAGFLASGFSSYVTGSSIVVDGGSSIMNPLTVPI